MVPTQPHAHLSRKSARGLLQGRNAALSPSTAHLCAGREAQCRAGCTWPPALPFQLLHGMCFLRRFSPLGTNVREAQ